MDSSFVSIAFVCVPRGQELGSMCGDCRNHRARLPHWLTARQLGHSLASLSFLSMPPLSGCTGVHRMHFVACYTANSTAANVSPIYLRDCTQLSPPSSLPLLPTLLPLLLITSLLPSVSSWTSLVHLDRSFCSRFFGYLLDSLYFSFRFSSRIYWTLLHGCFLCASLSCLIIILSTMFTFHAFPFIWFFQFWYWNFLVLWNFI